MESQDASKGVFPFVPQSGPVYFPQGPIAVPVHYQHRWKDPQQKVLKGDPKALGTVQIMIAFMNFSLGMLFVLLPEDINGRRHFLVYTGYVFWGTAFFIISGSLSIAAEKRATTIMVQSSLAMNVVSSVMAGLGIVFLSINLVTHLFLYYCREEGSHFSCFTLIFLFLGINVILLILAVLEFLVSIITSSFGCKALCCGQSEVTHIWDFYWLYRSLSSCLPLPTMCQRTLLLMQQLHYQKSILMVPYRKLASLSLLRCFFMNDQGNQPFSP
ncbi:membrane-spanning 4-domains subfamily A member 4A-like isoform X1 [Monodelphis domestica]|uniref:membrane-spanning 4-domains subfamily A member 4A-like isoform X1 n=2 Tax=Monodelphis domestica TaxID=13616 RepID=UPI0024E24FD6|nr:membrane-spanning 4-domains subfamily A member 4A-like isoform X1 [Monodelphis domestica]